MEKKFIRVDIVDNEYDYGSERIMDTYILVKPNMEKLKELQILLNNRFDENNQFERLTEYSVDEYNKIWGQFDSELFRFKSQMWNKKIHNFCYVGDWGYSVNIADGNIFRCSSCGHIGNVFKDKKLPRRPACKKCPFLHCYNAHGWLGLGGMVPDIKSPTYAQMRDRVRTDGTHWILPRMRAVFESKISDNNTQYSKLKKLLLKLNK